MVGLQAAQTRDSLGQSALKEINGVHGCLQDKLGSNREGRTVREVWEPPWYRTYLYTGNESGVSGLRGISTIHSWQVCSGEDGQFNRCLPHQPSRGTKPLCCLKIAQKLLS